jgi:hypothetical protein
MSLIIRIKTPQPTATSRTPHHMNTPQIYDTDHRLQTQISVQRPQLY